MELLIALIIILASALLQGMTSFGASLIATPLLLMFYGPELVVPLMVSFNMVMNLILFRKLYRYQNIRKIFPMLVTALIFTVVGILFFKEMSSSIIFIIIGVMLILLSVIKLLGIKIKVKQNASTYIPVGMISGLLNGIAGLSGPPVIIFLSANNVDKNQFRATLTTYFVVVNIFTVLSFIISGNYTGEVALSFVKLLPALLMGLLIGVRIGNKVNEKLFQRMLLLFLLMMGIYMIVKGF